MHTAFDRSTLRLRSLRERDSKVVIARDGIHPDAPAGMLTAEGRGMLEETVARVRAARVAQRPVILAFGAHTIKNGLGPVLIRLIESGWVTHLATNGAGVIHDWEFAFQGRSSEDVRRYVAAGQFGIWDETGININLALAVGAHAGMGYGESVGALIEHEALRVPAPAELTGSAAGLDLADVIRRLDLKPGRRSVPHPFKAFSVQAAAFRRGVPFTGHPQFGHDIIYTHPASCGAAIGRTAERDFLAFAHSVSQLDGGVYLSVGSAVMSPMIFEKSLAMANNVAVRRTGKPIQNHFIVVVDLAESTWNWQRDGEPPADNPAYYLRYCKTFARMGGDMRYLCASNRDFLPALWHGLNA